MMYLITFLALGAVIFIHELGHLVAAKKSGVNVYEFSIGMGPKVIGKTVNGTLYSLRLLPFGGFVKLAGMDDPDSAEVPPEENFYNKPIRSRFITLAAGSMMNVLLGFVIFTGIFWSIGAYELQVNRVLEGSVAEQSGLLQGDVIKAVNHRSGLALGMDVVKLIQRSPDKQISIQIQRDNQRSKLELTPANKDGKGQIGVQFKTIPVSVGPFQALNLGLKETSKYIKYVFTSIRMLVSGEASVNDMAGPVGIIQMASFSLNKGALSFLNFMAIISISLGIFNLFPFPVLDGGHIFLLGIEAVRKKRLSRKSENIINTAGAAVLITVMALVVVNDIINWNERITLLKGLMGQ